MVGTAFTIKTEMPKKLVGAYIDEGSAHHLSLLSLINDKSKSGILTDLLYDYLANQASVDCLIKAAANRAIRHWHDYGWNCRRNTEAFKKFRDESIKDLKKNRLPIELINRIIKEIEIGIGN